MKDTHTVYRGRTPRRTRITAAAPYIRGALIRIDDDMSTGARTVEAVLLRRVRERGTWPHRTAWELEAAKGRARELLGGVPSNLLCSGGCESCA